MSAEFNARQIELIEQKNFAHIATLFPDGSPQVTPVWVDLEDGKLRINSVEGRKKVDNLRADPRVSVEINNSENPYEYVEVRGRVVELRHEGAAEHIEALSQKYFGTPYPFWQDGEQRVTMVIEADRIAGNATASG